MPNQSVRFTADGQYYSRSGLDPVIGEAFTILQWIRLHGGRNYNTGWCLDSGGSSSTVGMQTGSSTLQSTMRLMSGSGSNLGFQAMALDTWYCFGVVRTGLGGTAGSVRALHGTDPNALNVYTYAPSSWGQWSTQASFTMLRLGWTVWAGEWLNGNLAANKIYTRALSNAEIAEELRYYDPVSRDGLYSAYSFWDGPSTEDTSGNGRPLTGGVGAIADPGPPGVLKAPEPPGPTIEPGRFLLAAA